MQSPAPVHVRLSIAEAAEHAHVSKDTIRRRIADGTLPAERIGRKIIRVDRSAVDAMFRPIPTAGRDAS